MMRRFHALLLFGLFLLPWMQAHAQHRFYNAREFAQLQQTGAGKKPGASLSYTGALDVIGASNAPACYSVMSCSSSYVSGTHYTMNIQRASDNQTCDVLIASTGLMGNTANCSGGANGTLWSTYCSGTTCTMLIWYDQKGNTANNLVVPGGGGGNQPATLVANAFGTVPGLYMGNGYNYAAYQTTGFTSSAAQPVTLSVVFYLGTGGTATQWFAGFGACCTGLGFNVSGQAFINAGGTTQTATMSLSTVHEVIASFGSATSINIDGTLTTTGSAGTNGFGSTMSVAAGNGPNYPVNGIAFEYVPIAAALSTGGGGQQAQLCANQSSRFGNGAACGD